MSNYILEWEHCFTFLSALHEWFNFATFTPTLVIVYFFYHSYSSGNEVISHCDFDLHFTNDWYIYAFFCAHLSFVYSLRWNGTSCFYLFSNWIFLLFSLGVLYIFEIRVSIIYIVCKYTLLVYTLSFYSLTGIFEEQRFLILLKYNLFSFMYHTFSVTSNF